MNKMDKNTIQSAFLKIAVSSRDKTAFHYFDESWRGITYGELLSSSKTVASYLVKTGIKKGDRIAIISENRPEWCIAYMGIMLAGAIAVPIDAQLTSEAVRIFLTDSETKIVFCSSKTTPVTTEGSGIKKIDVDSTDFKEILGFNQTAQFPDACPEDIASIIYTSGTTGIPKGVMLTHKNFCSDAEAIIKAGVITRKDNVLSLLPLHHTYPFMCTFLAPVFLGATVTFSPSLKGTDIVTAIKEKGATILIGVPQLLELIRSGIMNKLARLPFPVSPVMKNLLRLCGCLRRKTSINAGKLVFGSAHKALGRQFRFFASGGARLDPLIMRDLEAVGFTVLEGYGLTETSPVVAFNPVKKRKAGSVGKPLPSVEIKAMDSVKGESAAMQEGEIAIKGPMVMRGYYKNPDATAQAIRDKWFFSGDLGYFDEDGYLFITGRIKEVIVLSSGKNVYPEEIEKEYLKIPLIKEVCVYGLEEGGMDSLHALIVPDADYARQNHIGNIQEALRWGLSNVSVRLPSYMRIKGFELYSEPLPRTPLGKLRRFMIKDLVKTKGEKLKIKNEDEKLAADETGRRVADCIKPLLREEIPMQATDNLELDLGLDSLQRIELVVAIENEFSVKLPETFVSDVQTVEELIEKIKTTLLCPRPARGEAKVGVLPGQERGLAAVFSQEPSEKEKQKVGLKQGSIEWFFTASLMGILKLLFKVFFRLEVAGIENIPAGAFIIAPNHCSNLDGFIVGAGVPLKIFRNLYFQGFQAYFRNRPASLFARLAHVIPIDPETFLGKALQMSAFILKNNKSLCIFPEGGRSYDGNIMGFKKGIGILALELNAAAVPAFIEGSFDSLPKGAGWPKFKKIKLTFGRPLHPSDLDLGKKPEGIDRYQFFADELRERVRRLI